MAAEKTQFLGMVNHLFYLTKSHDLVKASEQIALCLNNECTLILLFPGSTPIHINSIAINYSVAGD